MTFCESYELPYFLEKTSLMLEQNEVNGVTSMWREKLYNESFSPDIDITIPVDGMNQLTSILCSMEAETKNIIERLKHFTPADESRLKTITLSWRSISEVSDIKLQYITSFMDKVEKECEKIADGDSILKTFKTFKDPMYLRNLKADVVKTTLPYYMTAKDMITVQKTTDLSFSKQNVDDVIMDFLLEFYNMRLKSQVKKGYFKDLSFKRESKLIQRCFHDAINRSMMLKESLKTSVEDGNKNYVEELFYVINMNLLQLAQYVIAVYMRTLTSYISNMREIMRAMNMLGWNTGVVDEALTESVEEIMDTCTLENPTALLTAASNIMISMKNVGRITKESSGFEDGTFDKYSYTFPLSVLSQLDERLKRLILTIRDDEVSPIVDILQDCQLSDNSLNSLFVDTSRAENLNFLKSVGFDDNFIYVDLKLMIYYIKELSSAVGHMKDSIIGAYIHAIETNPNGVFKNGLRNKETIDFLVNLLERVSSYARDLGKSYTRRLISISNIVRREDQTSVDISLEPGMYFGDAITSSYDVITESSDRLNMINQKFELMFISTATGNDFYEAENENTDQTPPSNEPKNNDQKPANNGNQTQNNKSEESKNSTKPVVNDGGNTTSNDSSNNDSGKGSGVQRIKDFIQKLITQMKDFFAKGSKKKNLDFLTANEQYLLNRNYTNTSISVMPYIETVDPIKYLTKLIETISTLDKNTLANADEKTLQQRVFASLKLPNSEDMSLDARIEQALKFGSKKPEMITLANGNLKAKIPVMIKFCKTYYTTFISDLENVENKLDSVSTLGSAFMNEGKTKENVNLVCGYVLSAIRAAKNASRDRCNDYMLILSALAKGNKNTEKTSSTTKDTGEEPEGNENK